MRFGLLVTACGFVAACVGAARTAPVPKGAEPDSNFPPAHANEVLTKSQPIDKKYPLPQDPAKSTRLRAAHLAAYRKATVEVFDATGNTKAVWAPKARAAMEAYCRRQTRRMVGLRGAEFQELRDAVTAAIDAGCDDVMVEYWHTRFYAYTNPDLTWNKDQYPLAKQGERARAVLGRLPRSPYPASVRVHAVWNCYMDLKEAGTAKLPKGVNLKAGELDAAEKLFWDTFAELARAEDQLSRDATHEISGVVIEHYQHRGDGAEAAWTVLEKALATAKVPEWLRLTVEGYFLVRWGWEARGNGTADKVTPEGHRLLVERLTRAKDRLEKSWKAEPTFAFTAVHMLMVARGLSLERDEMELWFRRAMEADPDCTAACRSKMIWLCPWWHGQHRDEVYEFAYQCYRTRNWYAGIALLLDVNTQTNPQFPGEKAYGKSLREPVTWRNTKVAYEGYLTVYPTDRWARSRYAAMCVTAGHYPEAVEQFAALKDRPWASEFPTKQVYEEYREAAKQGKLKKKD